jgi:hypothetical protein
MSKIVMTAIAFGTAVGAAGILHTDPDGIDPRARHPEVAETDADLLERKRLAIRGKHDFASLNAAEIAEILADMFGDGSPDVDPVGDGAQRLKQTAKIDNKAGSQPSGLDTRQSVNFADDAVVRGAVTGMEAPSGAAADEDDDEDAGEGDGEGDNDGEGGEDPDAPPAAVTATATTAPKSSTAPKRSGAKPATGK